MLDKTEKIMVSDDGTLNIRFYCNHQDTMMDLRYCESKCANHKNCADAKKADKSLTDFTDQWINGNQTKTPGAKSAADRPSW